MSFDIFHRLVWIIVRTRSCNFVDRASVLAWRKVHEATRNRISERQMKNDE